MHLTVLGSGTAVPVARRGNPAYLLDINGETLLLDCGAGTARQIVRAGRSIWELQKIYLSHLHPDHIMGLIPLLFAYKNSGDQRIYTELQIFGHKDFQNYLAAWKDLYGDWIFHEDYPCHFHPLQTGEQDHKRFKVQVFPAQHTPQSLIYRFADQAGRTLVYTGDTELCTELYQAAEAADLLLIECALPDSETVTGHLTPQKVRQVVTQVRPTRVVLTHIYPHHDDDTLLERVGSVPGVKIEVARDLAVLHI